LVTQHRPQRTGGRGGPSRALTFDPLTVRRAIIYPGIGTADPDASLPSGFAGQRLEYTLSQVIPLAVMILIGLLAAEAEGRIS
jgi:hypothetical protein